MNAERGFFFAHVGWLLVRKHPELVAKAGAIDMSDVQRNPVLAFNKRHYGLLSLVLAMVVPLAVPVWGWHETWLNSFCVAVVLRWVCSLNAIGMLNSVAHWYGSRPFDRHINATQMVPMSLLNGGEAFHNYHHAFPWDYRASDHGYWNTNKMFVDVCERFGLASDLKTVDDAMIGRRVRRTGDGSHEVWGWGDADQTAEERELMVMANRRKGAPGG